MVYRGTGNGFPASFRARLPSLLRPARAQSGASAGAAALIGNCALLGRTPGLLRLRPRSRVPAAALRSVRASLRRVRLLAACGRVLACGYVGGKFPDGIRTGLKSAPAASDAMQCSGVRARSRLRALFSGRALGSSPRAARGSSQFAWGFFCPALLALRALRRACPLLGASPARYVGGYPHLLFPPPLCRRRRSVIIGAGLGYGARPLAPLRSRRAPCWGAPAGARGSGDEGISRQA